MVHRTTNKVRLHTASRPPKTADHWVTRSLSSVLLVTVIELKVVVANGVSEVVCTPDQVGMLRVTGRRLAGGGPAGRNKERWISCWSRVQALVVIMLPVRIPLGRRQVPAQLLCSSTRTVAGGIALDTPPLS